jgi:hypothetical protein
LISLWMQIIKQDANKSVSLGSKALNWDEANRMIGMPNLSEIATTVGNEKLQGV